MLDLYVQKVVCAFVLLMFPLLTFSQQIEKERIQEINKEIAIAVGAQDYEQAAALKKEKELLEQIIEAINNGDYERAARLKNEIAKHPKVQIANTRKRLVEIDNDIKTAVDQGDYELAAELKKQKKDLEQMIEVLENRGSPNNNESLSRQAALENNSSAQNTEQVPILTSQNQSNAELSAPPSLISLGQVSLDISNLRLNFGEDEALRFDISYLYFWSNGSLGLDDAILDEHGFIGDISLGWAFSYASNVTVNNYYMNLGAGYALNLDAWTGYATININALNIGSTKVNFNTETFSSFFPEGASFLRLGAVVRPFFAANSQGQAKGDYKYHSFNFAWDIGLSGGSAFLIGYTTSLVRF